MSKRIAYFLTALIVMVACDKTYAASDSSGDIITKVQIGVRDQALPDITITEPLSEPANFNSGAPNKIALRFPTGVVPTNPGSAFVSSGDLVIDPEGTSISQGIDLGNGISDGNYYYVWIKVKSPSTKPSSITFHGIKVAIDRTVPEGKLTLTLLGDYLNDTQSQFPGDDSLPSVDVAEVVNPVTEKPTAKFVIGQSIYTVNGQEKNSDTVPFVDDNGHTLLPLRTVAEALGAMVGWDPTTQTASILKNRNAISVTLGDSSMNVDGVSIPIESTAINKDGHVFLPFRSIAQALGAQVNWDAEKQTVTIK